MTEQHDLENIHAIIDRRILSMRERGFTYVQICKTLGVGKTRITSVLRKNGLDGQRMYADNPEGAKPIKYRRMRGQALELRDARILKVYKEEGQNMTHAEIGERVGCSGAVVGQTLRKYSFYRIKSPNSNKSKLTALQPEPAPLLDTGGGVEIVSTESSSTESSSTEGSSTETNVDRLIDEIGNLNKTMNLLLTRQMAKEVFVSPPDAPRRRKWYKFW